MRNITNLYKVELNNREILELLEGLNRLIESCFDDDKKNDIAYLKRFLNANKSMLNMQDRFIGMAGGYTTPKIKLINDRINALSKRSE